MISNLSPEDAVALGFFMGAFASFLSVAVALAVIQLIEYLKRKRNEKVY